MTALTAVLALGSTSSAFAQEKRIAIAVQTYEHAAVSSARLYAGVAGTDYFVDSAHLSPLYAGTATEAGTLATFADLIPTATGDGFTGVADSATFATSFVVVGDANGHYYVLGDAADRNLGIVRAAHLFDGLAPGDTLTHGSVPMTVGENMLMPPTARIRDNHQTLYGSLAAGVANPMADTLFFLTPITVSDRIAIDRDVVIAQNGLALTNQCTGDMCDIGNNAYVTWQNGSIATPSSTGDHIFNLHNAGLFLTSVDIVSAGSVVRLEGGSSLMAMSSTLTTTAPNVAVVIIRDQSTAMINNVGFSGGLFGVSIVSGSTGMLVISEQTVNNNMSSYAVPVNAYAYSQMGTTRTYRRTLQLAAANADTVHLARTMPASMNDTVGDEAVVELMGDSILGGLHVMHSTGTVVIEGGVVNSLTGSATSTAALVLQGLDSVGTLAPGSHSTEVLGGRYHAITPESGADITLAGGKYTREYAQYLAPRHTFVANTDVADSAVFGRKVVAGNKVLYVNYDCHHRDTVIVYNEADNKIRPVLASPRYPGSDTMFIAWYTDSAFTNAWNAIDDELSQDTVLYARWYIMDTTSEYRYIVRHHFINLAGDTTLHDSIMLIAPKNSVATLALNQYEGRHCTDTSASPSAQITKDSMYVDLYYALNQYCLTWNANGGKFADGTTAKTDTLLYTQAILPNAVPTRVGHTFIGWPGAPSTMPSHDLTVYASYIAHPRTLTWVGADTIATYTSFPITGISASYKDDDSNTVQATISFIAPDMSTISSAVKVGAYTVVATPTDTNYHLTNPTKSLIIQPANAGVSVARLIYDPVKYVDGTDNVQIAAGNALAGILGSDQATLNATARYDNALPGTGKTITAHFSLSGADAANYLLTLTDTVLTTQGIILDTIALNTDTADQGIALNAYGYCSGSDTIRYFLQSGSPDEYSLTFDDADILNQHFVNTGWAQLNPATPGIIIIDIPADAEAGDYTVILKFRDSAYPTSESQPIAITLHVNLPRTYTMPLFADVIALVDTCLCFSDIQWYHNGVAIPGANGYYYQEVGGLTGEYHVTARMNGRLTASCTQDDVTTLLSDNTTGLTTVSAFPNPTADHINIHIDGTRTPVHSLKVVSVMGMTMTSGTFEGDSTTIDLGSWQPGNYIVSVDGHVVRIIKK